MMTVRRTIAALAGHEGLNFLVTNRIPRRLSTRFLGWFSRIERPWVRAPSITVWRLFCDVDLADARTTRFRSLHDAFVRELHDGARPADPDPDVLASPCDAIVGACGRIEGDRLYQVKGSGYRLVDLLGDESHAEAYRDGRFVTLRLTAGMYHHFHAPHDLEVEAVTYIDGDVWNVNPAALKRVERLYCRNERAAIRTRLEPGGEAMTLVAVAAILVAGIRLPFLADPLRGGGTRTIPTAAEFAKGERIGWFEHGSTIVMFVPDGFEVDASVHGGTRLRAGSPLLRRTIPARSGGRA